MLSIARGQIFFYKFPETGRKRLDASRSLYSRCYEIDGICRKQGRSADTDCKIVPTKCTNSAIFKMVNNFKKP
jgi:hypothetical protein